MLKYTKKLTEVEAGTIFQELVLGKLSPEGIQALYQALEKNLPEGTVMLGLNIQVTAYVKV